MRCPACSGPSGSHPRGHWWHAGGDDEPPEPLRRVTARTTSCSFIGDALPHAECKRSHHATRRVPGAAGSPAAGGPHAQIMWSGCPGERRLAERRWTACPATTEPPWCAGNDASAAVPGRHLRRGHDGPQSVPRTGVGRKTNSPLLQRARDLRGENCVVDNGIWRSASAAAILCHPGP
jgi:hypothetical protein